jgi:hypothetical protein
VALWRARAIVVLFVALVHVGSGVLMAIGACCASDDHHGAPKMECCLKGGPNHICPFMSKTRRSNSPGKINVYCPAGHDAGVPVTGFTAMPEPAAAAAHVPAVSAVAVDGDEREARQTIYPPTPPPKVLL